MRIIIDSFIFPLSLSLFQMSTTTQPPPEVPGLYGFDCVIYNNADWAPLRQSVCPECAREKRAGCWLNYPGTSSVPRPTDKPELTNVYIKKLCAEHENDRLIQHLGELLEPYPVAREVNKKKKKHKRSPFTPRKRVKAHTS